MRSLADGGRDRQRPKCQPVTQGTAPQGARYAKASHVWALSNEGSCEGSRSGFGLNSQAAVSLFEDPAAGVQNPKSIAWRVAARSLPLPPSQNRT